MANYTLTREEKQRIMAIRASINEYLFLGTKPNWNLQDLISQLTVTILGAVGCYALLVLMIGLAPMPR